VRARAKTPRRWRLQGIAHRVGERGDIADRHEPAPAPVFEDLVGTARAGRRDDRLAERERFDEDGRQAFAARREHEQIGACDPRRDRTDATRQLDGIVQLETADLGFEPRALLALAEDQQPRVEPPAQLREGLEQVVEALDEMQPAGGHDERALLVRHPRMLDLGPRGFEEARAERRVVDRVQARRIDAEVVAQIGGKPVADGDDGVGLAEMAAHAVDRPAVLALRQPFGVGRKVLALRQHHVHAVAEAALELRGADVVVVQRRDDAHARIAADIGVQTQPREQAAAEQHALHARVQQRFVSELRGRRLGQNIDAMAAGDQRVRHRQCPLPDTAARALRPAHEIAVERDMQTIHCFVQTLPGSAVVHACITV